MITHTPFIPGAVLLDMDGLMLDTERPAVALWVQAAQSFGIQMSRDVIFKTIGINEKDSKALLMNEYGPDFPYHAIRGHVEKLRFEKIEREGIDHRPGLEEFLDRLDELSIPYAVATSTKAQKALWKLEKARIRERFKVFVFGDEVERGKPAPDIFLRAAERLGKAPQDCLGFEDSAPGLQSLHSAGIPSVFIQDVVMPPPEVLAAVWRQCKDLTEAAALFG
jgi:HAD superfamily hydrolase (TIGR01509 family)